MLPGTLAAMSAEEERKKYRLDEGNRGAPPELDPVTNQKPIDQQVPPGTPPPPPAPKGLAAASGAIQNSVQNVANAASEFTPGPTPEQARAQRLSEQSGPSAQREQDLYDQNNKKGKPYIRAVDPTAYQEQEAQLDARTKLNTLYDRYAEDRVAPQATSAQVKTSIDQPVTGPASAAKVNVGPASGYNAAQIGPTAQVQNVNLGAARMANAAGVDATGINRTEDQQLRSGQLSQVGRLEDQAAGLGPSLADATLKKGVNASIAAQAAGSASMRGAGGPVGANRALANNAAIAQANAVGKAAELKVAERQEAERQLTGALSGARGQDIGVNQAQASITAAERSQASAQQQQVELANQAAENERAYQQGTIDFQTYSQNAEMINANRQRQAELEQQANSELAAAKNANTLSQAGIDQSKALADQQAFNDFNTRMLDRDTQFKLAQLGADQQAEIANLESKLRMAGMDDAMRANLMSQTINQANVLAAQGIAYDTAQIARSIARNDASNQMKSGFQKFMDVAVPVAGVALGGGQLAYNMSKGNANAEGATSDPYGLGLG
jgi:hypothetical protein